MENIVGVKFKVSGESEYKNALRNINLSLKEMSSELKLSTAQMNNSSDKTKALSSVSDALNNKLNAQKDGVNTLVSTYNNYAKGLEEVQKEHDELSQKYKTVSAQAETLKNTVGEESEEYKKCASVIEGLSEDLKKNETTQKNIQNTMTKVRTSINNYKTGVEETKNKINNLGKEEDSVSKKTSIFGDVLKANLASKYLADGIDAILGKVKGLFSSLGSIGNMTISGGIDRALNLENAQAKMSTFVDSSEQLDEIMKNVSDSVDGTAFSMDSAATVASGLFAAGIKEGDDMTKALKLVGDASQVSGRSMEEMGAIFNKIAANGKISGEELNQLSDSGIPILQMLSETMGVSTEEVRNLVSAGKVGFSEFEKAMEQGLGGAAQKSGETFTSSLANLKSALSRVGAEIMTPLLEGITPVMNTFKDMIKNMVAGNDISENMSTLMTQLQKFVSDAVTHLNNMVDKYMPVINQMLQGIIQMIPQLLPQIIPLITNLFTSISTLILDNLPLILNTILQTIEQLATALGEQLPTLIPQIINCLVQMINTILDNIDLFIDAGIQLLIGLAQGLVNALPDLIDKLPEMIDKIIEAVTENLPKLVEAGIQLTVMLAIGLVKAIPQLISKVPQIIKSLFDGFKNYYINWGDIGKNVIKGIADGFKKAKEYISKKIKETVDNIKDGFKKLLGIHSPSTWARDYLGVNFAKGFGIGFEDEMKDVTKNMQGSIPKKFNYPSGEFQVAGNSSNDTMGDFNLTINNNSRNTGVADNVREFRREYQLWLLKHGKVA